MATLSVYKAKVHETSPKKFALSEGWNKQAKTNVKGKM